MIAHLFGVGSVQVKYARLAPCNTAVELKFYGQDEEHQLTLIVQGLPTKLVMTLLNALGTEESRLSVEGQVDRAPEQRV